MDVGKNTEQAKEFREAIVQAVGIHNALKLDFFLTVKKVEKSLLPTLTQEARKLQ